MSQVPNCKPNWKSAPKNANWWAVDADRVTALWYVRKPKLDISNGFWSVPGSHMGDDDDSVSIVDRSFSKLPGHLDWKKTLQERPAAIDYVNSENSKIADFISLHENSSSEVLIIRLKSILERLPDSVLDSVLIFD